jgi:hypothetical protein
MTAGTGLELRWWRLRFSPVLRYTRWQSDLRPLEFPQAPTKLDQVELVLEISFWRTALR